MRIIRHAESLETLFGDSLAARKWYAKEEGMAAVTLKDIQLTSLQLALDNPRHQDVGSQVEVLEWMLSEHRRIGEKVLALAKDIVSYGLNPADHVMVMEHKTDSGTYVVLEGNRRIAALRLLNNPDIAPTKRWKERFSKLSRQGYSPIRSVPCVVFHSRSEADHFVEIRHLGEAGGAGIVGWDALQKARHEERKIGRSRNTDALEILSFVIQRRDLFDEKTRQAASDDTFKITNLQRLLSDREFRQFLGLGRDKDGEIVFTTEPAEAAKAVTKVIEDFGPGENRMSVREIINKEKRKEYMAKFGTGQLPNHSKQLKRPMSATSKEVLQERPSGGPMKAVPPKRVYADPKNRNTIVIGGDTIPIDPRQFTRANQLFRELKQIELRKKDRTPVFPNAGVLLVRTFIEISVNTYIKQLSLRSPSPKGWGEISLVEKIKSVLKDLKTRSAITKLETKVITKILGDPNKIAHPNSINDMIHNLNQMPTPSDIIHIWDQYKRFLQCLWGILQHKER
jgi:hypothetical protein